MAAGPLTKRTISPVAARSDVGGSVRYQPVPGFYAIWGHAELERTMTPLPGFYAPQWTSRPAGGVGRIEQPSAGAGGGVMVRGSGIDDAARSAVYPDGPEMDGGEPGQPAGGRSRPARSWNGAGGRWLVWTLRAVVWAVLLIIGYRGVMAIVLNETPASRSGTPAVSAGDSGQFPVTLAEAYAMQFGDVYLNFTPASAGQRAQELAAYLPGNLAGADPQLGWNGSGALRLRTEQVAGISVRDATHAVVTLLANVNGQLMELGVPIYAARGGMAVSGEPAWLAAPAQASPPASVTTTSDPAAQNALTAQLPAFFQAYASGDGATLNRFLAQGATVSGLGGALSYAGISTMYVPPGGPTRHITVTVVWQLSGQAAANAAKLEMTYDMTVIDEQSGKWYVGDIQASTQGNQEAGG
jgi:Conjugative transposon protein TcpC